MKPSCGPAPKFTPEIKANNKIEASKNPLQTFVLSVKCMRNIGPPTMRPAPPCSVYRPTNRYFLHHALTRFCALQTTENSCVEPFLAMASRTKTSLPFDAENTGYDDEKSFSTAPRSCQKLTSVDAGDFLFFVLYVVRLVKYKFGILNQTFSLITRRCQYQPPFHV